MKKAFLFLLAFCIFGIYAFAQSPTYTPLKNIGLLPDDLTGSPYEKYLGEITNRGEELSSDHDHFLLKSNYLLDQLMRSGYILYNDPISEYANKVLAAIINSNPEVAELQPRIYVLKSAEVNALAVDQGIIFVTMGLIAQLEDEAQLAVVLCHELTHVMEKHGLDGYLEEIRIDKENRRSFWEIGDEEFDLATIEKNRYSRTQEIEADEKGLQMFLKTPYSIETIPRIYDILRYAYLPYDELYFQVSFLESLNVKIPYSYIISQVKPINHNVEDEEQSSHPALSNRLESMTATLKDVPEKASNLFSVSKNEFEHCQYLARMELPAMYLAKQQLSEAIYTSYLLQSSYQESAWTTEITAKALYGWAKFKSHKEQNALGSPKAEDVEGQSQRVAHLMGHMSGKELTILALAYNYSALNQYPENECFRDLTVDLFHDLSYIHKIRDLNYFSKPSEQQIDSASNTSPPTEPLINNIDLSKTKLQPLADSVHWTKVVFIDVLNDSIFITLAQEGFGRVKKQWWYNTWKQNVIGIEEGRVVDRKLEQIFSLDIDSVLIIDPVFIQFRKGFRGELDIDHFVSANRSSILKEVLQQVAVLNEVDINILDSRQLQQGDVQTLNDIALANQWIHTQLDAEKVYYLGYQHQEMKGLAERYGTPYIMKIGVVSIRQFSPFARLLNRKSTSLIFAVVFDARNGQRAFIKANFLSYYMNDSYLKSEFFDVFLQLSNSVVK